MDKIENNIAAISLGNSAAIVVLAFYFYRKCEMLENEIKDLKSLSNKDRTMVSTFEKKGQAHERSIKEFREKMNIIENKIENTPTINEFQTLNFEIDNLLKKNGIERSSINEGNGYRSRNESRNGSRSGSIRNDENLGIDDFEHILNQK